MSRKFVRKEQRPAPAEPHEADGLSEAELAGEVGEALPDRAALSTLDADIAIPLNAAMAADVLAGEAPGEDDAEDVPGDGDPA